MMMTTLEGRLVLVASWQQEKANLVLLGPSFRSECFEIPLACEHSRQSVYQTVVVKEVTSFRFREGLCKHSRTVSF